MPASATFIVSQANAAQACYREVCLLVNETFKQKKSIQILCVHPQEQQCMIEGLWTCTPHAFIPNTSDENQFMSHPLVLLTLGPQANINSDLVINLTHEPVVNAQQHKRVIEWVSDTADTKAVRRNNYKLYQSLNMVVASKKFDALCLS